MSLKKKKADPETLVKRLANLADGRDEMNLCELPFATLSERSGNRSTLHFEIEDFDREMGETVHRKLTVKGDPEFGLPTEKDEEIYLGLLKYSSDYNGFSDPEVRLSRSALFEMMGWPKSDWAYARLTKGMHRLVGVRLSYQNFWRDNRDKQWRDQGAFGILDSFEFRDSRIIGASTPFAEHSSVFRWGSVLFQSFDSRYIKRIDYGLTRDLSPAARRLYRYLDKHFYPPKKTTIKIDVARLAYQHIGISPGVKLDKARKRHLESAARELEAAGFLRPAPEGRFRQLRRGIWEATFTLADEATKTDPRSDEFSRVVDALGRRGVSTEKAITFAASFGVEQINAALQCLDEQQRNGVVIRLPDAWLKTALEKGFKPSGNMQRSSKRPELRVFRASRRAG